MSRIRQSRKAIEGIRWLIAYSSSSRSKAQTRKINLMEKSNNKIFRAWFLKNRASGFKSLKGFENMIYLCAGDLDIVGSFPKRFCTL